MDDAEIARLRESIKSGGAIPGGIPILAILDALEQAQKERGEARENGANIFATLSAYLQQAISERDQAQQSAKDARALLEHIVSYLDEDDLSTNLRAQIKAVLEQKP